MAKLGMLMNCWQIRQMNLSFLKKYAELREWVSLQMREANKAISLNEIKEIVITLFEGGQEERLLTQSTELSTEHVVIPVENPGKESPENVIDTSDGKSVDNCTNNSIFSVFSPVNGKIMSGENIRLKMFNGCVDAVKSKESLIVRGL
ncbi:MAG: hypothetical protein ACL7BU_06225 [Candidatus Phlomobacter fragariae]